MLSCDNICSLYSCMYKWYMHSLSLVGRPTVFCVECSSFVLWLHLSMGESHAVLCWPRLTVHIGTPGLGSQCYSMAGGYARIAGMFCRLSGLHDGRRYRSDGGGESYIPVPHNFLVSGGRL